MAAAVRAVERHRPARPQRHGEGWDLSPRWDGEQRDRILVDVPESVLEQSRLRGWQVDDESAVTDSTADSWRA